MGGYAALPQFCEACGAVLPDGEDAHRGQLLWRRGDHVVSEEPPLCATCSLALGAQWFQRILEWEGEGD